MSELKLKIQLKRRPFWHKGSLQNRPPCLKLVPLISFVSNANHTPPLINLSVPVHSCVCSVHASCLHYCFVLLSVCLGLLHFLIDSCTDYYPFLLSSQKKWSSIKCHSKIKISCFYIATENTDDLWVFTQNILTDEHWSLHRLVWFVTYNCVKDRNPFKNSDLKVHTYAHLESCSNLKIHTFKSNMLPEAAASKLDTLGPWQRLICKMNTCTLLYNLLEISQTILCCNGTW